MQKHRCGRFARRTRIVVVLFALGGPVLLGHQGTNTLSGHVIRGRIVDPHQLRSEDAVLMLGHEANGSFGSVPVSTAADGSFVTRPVSAGTYVLQLVRTPHSPTTAATVVGLSIVRVDAADVSGVMIEVRRETALTGRFRMESDDPGAAWPTEIAVNGFLALDGMPLLGGVVAEGAAGGRFVLRNAFGPRVLRCGYTLAPRTWWWPSRVLLDGLDVTNVPTDFSTHENGQLEIVFAAQPARITGTVVDRRGLPMPAPWILMVAADVARRQQWATTTDVARGDTNGKFSLPANPGRYLVTAVGRDTFDSWPAARRQSLRFGSRGISVDVEPRANATVRLTTE